ncbi:GH3 auxin-responsive promoter family protein [Maridesulfovibrio sp.]|uniref:GH3 auxin-responsive promoter family protein n=1 Tax=Maridesulfovibrio sp. TaxID=2795000 RepID=UPI0029C9FD6F|nr:GH3 auxin-responsive promoter family protein [Maridesulfovibrio sp.]
MLVEDIYALGDRELFPKYLSLCENPQAVQEQLLRDILEENKDTALGKKYGFSKIESVEDFQKSLPVSGWDDIKSLSRKMELGEKDQLFAGQPKYFIVTSGTTGKCKYLPESFLGQKAKSITSKLRRMVIISGTPAALAGKIFTISNSAGIGQVDCGIPFGYASGVTLMETPAALRSKVAYPLDILNIQDQDTLDYSLMRFAIEQNVTAIIGNNAGRMEKLILMAQKKAEEIINDIEQGTLSVSVNLDSGLLDSLSMEPNPQRAEELRAMLAAGRPFLPVSYWPDLAVFTCWLGGSVGRYVQGVKPLLGEQVQYKDCGYGASEGKFNIPMKMDEPAGTLALLAAFYEFESLDDDGRIYQAHELEDGRQYKIIITTFSGLYRYDLKDIIEVRGFTGKTPNIFFVNKTKDVGNICGEKLSAQSVIEAVEGLAPKHGVAVKHFCAVADVENSRYDICMELDGDTAPSEAFAAELDAIFSEGIVYIAKRRQELLFAPRILVMEKGWQEALYAEKTGGSISIAQIKLPVIYDKIPQPDFVASIIE